MVCRRFSDSRQWREAVESQKALQRQDGRVSLPVIDLSEPMASTASAIERACRDSGFFYVAGHGVPGR